MTGNVSEREDTQLPQSDTRAVDEQGVHRPARARAHWRSQLIDLPPIYRPSADQWSGMPFTHCSFLPVELSAAEELFRRGAACSRGMLTC
jgi:hypothetical protein